MSLFDTPRTYVGIPRVEALHLSPDGDRLVAEVSQPDDDGGSFISALWELDPAGVAPARRLTRSPKGESGAAFLPDSSLLFTSRRPRPASAEGADEETAALWVLPAIGGDPWVVAARPGGVTGVLTGRATYTVVVAARCAPGGLNDDDDREWWKVRRKQKVSAVLHDSLQIRHWDRHLGPDEGHLLVTTVDPTAQEATPRLRDLTPDAGQALHDEHPVLTPDGSAIVTGWMVPLARGKVRTDLVVIDTETGTRRTLASVEDGSWSYASPSVSPDGRQVAALRTSRSTPTEPGVMELWVFDLASGDGGRLDEGDEPFIRGLDWTPDSSALILTADWQGRRPLYRLDLAVGQVTRLTGEGSWASPRLTPNGTAAYALVSAVDIPPRPVRLAMTATEVVEPGGATHIAAPGTVEVPGRLEEVVAEAVDGTPLRAWLVLPATASAGEPAPLALWVHGGPAGSWNEWHWRWNPWVLAAAGWAVLLPDPALSTGYGADMIRRGWGQWGGAPYDDVMTLTDAALTRPDLDEGHTAMMGGSYGGYMANWIAGHTERFGAIVSHASIWSLEQFYATTDWPELWAEEFGYPDSNPTVYRDWSPDRYLEAICTPMLVTHGNDDYRCPVSESLRLWTDLCRRGVEAKFLWFGAESHWIIKPGDSVVWYEAVLAFLAEKVLGRPWERPRLV